MVNSECVLNDIADREGKEAVNRKLTAENPSAGEIITQGRVADGYDHKLSLR